MFGILAFLTRPEGALIVTLLVIDHLRKRTFRTVGLISGAFGLIVTLLILAMVAFYGDFLPNSYYVKQEDGLNSASVTQTIFFITTIALPFIIASLYGSAVLRDSQSSVSLVFALTFIAYYLTVSPLMNVLSRYQWPSLVLLMYGSLPAFDCLLRKTSRYKIFGGILIVMMFGVNIGNFAASNYFATTSGLAMKNLIEIGKGLAPYRSDEQWLVYHDAGAICYFSNWNCYDTIGLNNRAVAKGHLSLTDILGFEHSLLAMQNIDLSASTADSRHLEVVQRFQESGFEYVDTLVTLREEDNREFGVMLFAREPSSVDLMISDMNLEPDMGSQLFYEIYALARRIVKNR